ncbi:MAG: DMT family transporter [candidate division Zixibacteria bacterium]|nr:DMT family transporter [candidate division Zixibacteria bacterium]MDH3938856.1 DMT family transporter [candidate division Zixibacteria bacterium]MDH4033179.1 DMT family transporter [candidate division Zixibacteria bacterium]
MSFIEPHFGEIIALLTAVVWAGAVILFKKSGETVHPIGLNLFKDLLALLLFLPTMWILGESLFRSVPVWDYILLLASGALGIGLADTLYFKSLNRLGAGLMSIVVCLYSPFIIVLSMFYLNETLTLWQVFGAGLIVSAVLAASFERQSNGLTRRQIAEGMIWGILAQIANGVGIVMIKPLLDRSPLLWVTEVRLVGGVAVLLIAVAVHKKRREIIQSVKSKQRWVYTLSGSIMGGFLAMVLWLGGMKFTQASIASALNQTASVFIFIFAVLFLKEPITRYRLIGIGLAMLGVMLVTVL